MPYVITTKKPYRTDMGHPDDPVTVYDLSQPDEPAVITAANADAADSWIQDQESRRAVATLEEARQAAASICSSSDHTPDRYANEAVILPESGGTIGPLPDGTLILVESADWLTLVLATHHPLWRGERPLEDYRAEIIAAYNEAQGSA